MGILDIYGDMSDPPAAADVFPLRKSERFSKDWPAASFFSSTKVSTQ